METDLHLIKNSDLLIKACDKWPSFHDSEIIAVTLQRTKASLTLEIDLLFFAKDLNQSITSCSQTHTIVLIKFEEISELELYDFNHQNAIFGLYFDRQEDNLWNVTIAPAHGISSKFICKDIEILDVRTSKILDQEQ